MYAAHRSRSIRWRKLCYRACYAFVIVAAIGIFIYTILLGLLADPAFANAVRGDGDDSPKVVFDVGHTVKTLFFASVVFLLHLTYLWKVAKDQVIGHAIEKFHSIEVFFVVALSLAYLIPLCFLIGSFIQLNNWLPALKEVTDTEALQGPAKATKELGTFCFAVIYLAWATADYRDLNKDLQDKGQKLLPLGSFLLRPFNSFFLRPLRGMATSISKRIGGKHASHSIDPSQTLIWFIIDLALAVALFAALILATVFEESKVFKVSVFDQITLKEIAVALALVARYGSASIATQIHSLDESVKHKVWQNAIWRPRNQPENWTADTSKANGVLPLHADRSCEIIVTDVHGRNANGNPMLSILVLNCGEGKRTAEILNQMTLRDKSGGQPLDTDYEVEVRAYNHDPDVGDRFRIGNWRSGLDNPDAIHSDQFTSSMIEASNWAAQSDVVIVLHSTYDAHEATRVESILTGRIDGDQIDQPAGVSPGAVLLFRGFADHSLLSCVTHQHPDKSLFGSPTDYHRWNHGFLRSLAHYCNWHIVTPYSDQKAIPVSEPHSPPCSKPDDHFYPIKVIRQHIRSESDQITSALHYLRLQLPASACDGLEEQLNDIAAMSTVEEMPLNSFANADDYLYCFYVPSEEITVEDRLQVEYRTPEWADDQSSHGLSPIEEVVQATKSEGKKKQERES